jgi:hypothetical protein
MTYTASVHVSGFVRVEVEADSIEDAKRKIENGNIEKLATSNADALVFNTFETEPEPEE